MTTYYVYSGVIGGDVGGLTGVDTNVDLATLIDGVVISQSDSNNGTDPLTPFATLGKLQSVMVAGDIAYISGVFYTDDSTLYAFTLTDVSNIELHQWPDMPQARIKMSNKTGTSGWTSAVGTGGATYYQKTLAAGLTISNVCFDWDLAANITSDLVHKSWLKSKALTNVQNDAPDTQGAWNYTSPTLTVRLPSSVSTTPALPAANGVEYVVAGRSGIGLLSSDTSTPHQGYVVDGLMIGPVCSGGASPVGCGVVFQNARIGKIKNNRIFDYGIHGISIGKLVQRVAISNNHITGGDGACSCAVFNASGSGNTTTGSSTSDRMFPHLLLGTDGLTITTGSCRGIEAHGSVTQIRIVNMQIKEYVPPSGAMANCYPYDIHDTASSVTDPLNPQTYPVQFIQTDPSIYFHTNGSHGIDNSLTACVSFTNCRFNYNMANNTAYGYVFDQRSFTGTYGFFGCELEFNLFVDGSTSMFVGGANMKWVFVNCSVFDNHTSDAFGAHYMFRWSASGMTVTAYGNIFGFRFNTTGTQICVGDGAIGTGHDFQDNAYYNVPSTTYSDNASFNTLAELDANGVLLSASPFNDTTGATGLDLNSSERRRKKRLTTHTVRGVNQRSYSGNYGAYQTSGSGLLLLGV